MVLKRPAIQATRRAREGFWQGLKEVSLFFQGKDEVHKTLRRLVRRLDKAGISYVVVGGIAVKYHKYRRTTADVDLLLTPQGLDEFRLQLAGKHYRPTPGRSRRFVDKVNEVQVDFLVAGLFPGSGKPGPITYPDPDAVSEVIEKVRVVNLPTLIELKLAARRHQDFADVVNLIRFNDLDETFAQRLHRSVRQDYIECLEEKRRDDEYDARNG